MKLLLVLPFVPFPPRTGNALIVYNHIKGLGARHTVDVVCFRDARAADLGDIPAACRRVELVPRPPRWRSELARLEGIASDRPLQVSFCRSPAMSEAVSRSLAQESYDVAAFYMTEMAQFRPAAYRGATVWTMEDPLVLKYERRLASFPWYARPLVRSRTNRRRRYERQEALRFDRVLLLNEADARDYADILRGSRLDWVPYGVDVEFFRPDLRTRRAPGRIVISGSMYHPPNVEAVERFCREVYPRVRAAVPETTLYLVGANPTESVRRWDGREGITVTGSVADLRPFLREAMVSVCAVSLAIGTQTKVLEAMACGTPVVTTTAGNRGILGISGRHLEVADAPEAMGAAVVALLRGERWADLSESGRRFVAENFTWSRSLDRLEAILREVSVEVSQPTDRPCYRSPAQGRDS